jgi:thymidylate synthase (FAD)
VSHEFCRHRLFSFAQESTRFCNYSKDKFGKEITFIRPLWLTDKNFATHHEFIRALESAERHYFVLIDLGWQPQQARAVLPNALKTELVMTGTETQWGGFLKLRCAPTAHPQARELALELKKLFENE